MTGELILRRCGARHGQHPNLQCQGEVTERTIHAGDHWAYDPDGGGHRIRWPELIAVYPANDPMMGAEVVRERLAAAGIGVANPERTTVGARSDQVGGEHYRKYEIQPWDIWQEYGLNAFEGAVLKYLLRRKGDRLEDLKKARHTLDRLIEIEEGKAGGGE